MKALALANTYLYDSTNNICRISGVIICKSPLKKARIVAPKSPEAASQLKNSRQSLRDGTTATTADSKDRIAKIADLLNEVSSLMRNDPQLDPKLLEQLRRLQVRLKIPIKRISARRNELPADAPAFWLEREDRDETPVDFIRREYSRWIGRGLARSHLRQLDRSLYLALYKYLAEGGRIPDDMDLPTKKTQSDRQLEQAGYTQGRLSGEQREAIRLYHLARDRSRRNRRSPGD